MRCAARLLTDKYFDNTAMSTTSPPGAPVAHGGDPLGASLSLWEKTALAYRFASTQLFGFDKILSTSAHLNLSLPFSFHSCPPHWQQMTVAQYQELTVRLAVPYDADF